MLLRVYVPVYGHVRVCGCVPMYVNPCHRYVCVCVPVYLCTQVLSCSKCVPMCFVCTKYMIWDVV